MVDKNEISETKVETINGVKYTTHYVNRPVRQGDMLGGPVGTTVDGEDKIIEIIKYVYTDFNPNF